MLTDLVKGLLKAVLVGAVVVFLSAVATAADAPENYQVVDGVAIYLGLMPAQIIEGHPMSHTEAGMHGGVPAGSQSNHVMVALFDAATGKRIGDAMVKAAVGEMGMGLQWKTLEPMQIADTITYGNYFVMPENGIYRIQVRIHLLGRPQPVVAIFTHQHFTQ